MTKQITAAERRETFSKGLKPVPPQSMTLPGRPSDGSMETSIAAPTEASQASNRPSSGRAPLKCQFELLSAIVKELWPLVQRNYNEVGLNGEPLDPDWDRLFALERAGGLLIWTARTKKGALVGYAECCFVRSFHSPTPSCVVEVVWLAPEWREGLRGFSFVRAMIRTIQKENRIKKIRIFTNADYEPERLGSVYKYLGFRKTGEMFDREL